MLYVFRHAPVAQLDRVPGFEPGCREFESLRARQLKTGGYGLGCDLFFHVSSYVSFGAIAKKHALNKMQSGGLSSQAEGRGFGISWKL